MEDAWKIWSTSPQNTQIRPLLLLQMWGIWLSRNKVIFHEEANSPEKVTRQELDILSYFPQTKNNISPRIIIPEQLDQNTPWAYFDGASQDSNCGGGATLFLNQHHHFQISMGMGSGTNNYAELMALKLFLCLVIERNCRNLQIFGDSLVVINGLNTTQRCRNTSLDAIVEEFSRLLADFDFLSLKHVYKERNMEADRLSKEGISLAWGTWKITEKKGDRGL